MMAVALVGGLVLVGLAVISLVRALTPRPGQAPQVVDQIGAYGFSVPEEAEEARHRSMSDVATSLGGWISRRRPNADDSKLRSRLVAAGWYSVSPGTFVGYQVISAVVFTAIWIVVGRLGEMDTALYIVGVLVVVVFGWFLPSIVLTRQVQQRYQQIDKALPELIDLLVVAVEAGLGFVAALRMTVQELDGPLAQELRLTLQEQTMGLSTPEALEGMARRVETPGVRSFVRSIVQGATLGISLGQILRNLADEMRKRRKAQAEEKAQKAPVKMLFPLVLLIFPAMFVVLLLPAIITISETLGG
jgi:tight adherence protein C